MFYTVSRFIDFGSLAPAHPGCLSGFLFFFFDNSVKLTTSPNAVSERAFNTLASIDSNHVRALVYLPQPSFNTAL